MLPLTPSYYKPTIPPRHASLKPTTPVSIILKKDQPTGRQVTGIVAEILTRGDHPRGVKVRLTDGRVGRVQQIITTDSTTTTSSNISGRGSAGGASVSSGHMHTGINEGGGGGGYGDGGGATPTFKSTQASDEGFFNTSGSGSGSGSRGRGRGGRRGRGRGMMTPRDSEGVERNEATTYDLTAFIVKDGRKGGKGRRGGGGIHRSQDISSTGEGTVRCPVCGDFEGDERAVEHHVESHFS
ncbi:hypothetical protein AA313_de0202778 [Arthrobotrys entomopaga]|nr:hypothetical protein AA313_de0202778 [Arthrobotrys entomopaga]